METKEYLNKIGYVMTKQVNLIVQDLHYFLRK